MKDGERAEAKRKAIRRVGETTGQELREDRVDYKSVDEILADLERENVGKPHVEPDGRQWKVSKAGKAIILERTAKALPNGMFVKGVVIQDQETGEQEMGISCYDARRAPSFTVDSGRLRGIDYRKGVYFPWEKVWTLLERDPNGNLYLKEWCEFYCFKNRMEFTGKEMNAVVQDLQTAVEDVMSEMQAFDESPFVSSTEASCEVQQGEVPYGRD